MGKRYTDTEKWNKPWFRALTPAHKLGWLYLCDRCDAAGFINVDRPLGDFQVGETLDWDQLIEAAAGRIVRLECGKWWLQGFIEYQYGKLSLDCKPHTAILKILVEYAKTERVVEDYLKGCQTLEEKEKEKDIPLSSLGKKGDARGKKPRPTITVADVLPWIPDSYNTPAVVSALEAWLKHKASKGESYRDGGYLGRMTTRFGSPAAFAAAVDFSIACNYSGIFAEKGSNGRAATTSRVGPGQRHRG